MAKYTLYEAIASDKQKIQYQSQSYNKPFGFIAATLDDNNKWIIHGIGNEISADWLFGSVEIFKAKRIEHVFEMSDEEKFLRAYLKGQMIVGAKNKALHEYDYGFTTEEVMNIMRKYKEYLINKL